MCYDRKKLSIMAGRETPDLTAVDRDPQAEVNHAIPADEKLA